jgi:hypothetical protein
MSPAEHRSAAEEMAEELEHAQQAGGSELALLLSTLLGPIAVWGDLQASYALVPRMCAAGLKWPLLLPTLFASALTALGAALSLRQRRRAAELQNSRAKERARFLGAFGLALSVFSFLALAAMALPKFILGACDL